MPNQGWSVALGTSQIDGTANTAGTRASMLPAQSRLIIPPFPYVGAGLRIRASGRISSVITTPGTARYDICLGPSGTIIVWDGLAILLDTVAAHSTVAWDLEILLTLRAVGSGTSANLMGVGKWTCEDILGTPATAPKGCLTAMLPWNTAPAVGAGFDSTIANTLDCFFTQTVATGSHTCHQFWVESVN